MDFNIMDYAKFIPILIGFVTLLSVYRVVFNTITQYNDQELMLQGNTAPALSRAGGYVGIGIATLGSLINSSEPYWRDVGIYMLDGVFAIVFFTVAMFALDVVILPNVENDTLLARNNVSVGIVEASGFVALGAIMCGAFSGSDPDFWQGIASALVFSAIGLVTLSVAYKIYDYWCTKRHGRDIDERVAANDTAVAIDTGSIVLSLGILLGFSISGDSAGWGEDLGSYAMATAMAILAINIVRIFSRVLVSRKLRHTNKAEATIRSAVTLSASLLIGLLIIS